MNANRKEQLRVGVQTAYSAAATQPREEHPFPVGRWFAESLGYPEELLDSLPASCSEAFTGVSNVAVFAEIPQGATVLDLGCGAGLDALIAARKSGPDGRVIGLDFSMAMLERAQKAAAQIGMEAIDFRQADAERIPLEEGQIDVALVNGIFNLNPAREAIFRELARVVKSGGGVVYAAELVLKESLPAEVLTDEDNWFA